MARHYFLILLKEAIQMRINLVHDKDNIKWIYFKLTSKEMNLDN